MISSIAILSTGGCVSFFIGLLPYNSPILLQFWDISTRSKRLTRIIDSGSTFGCIWNNLRFSPRPQQSWETSRTAKQHFPKHRDSRQSYPCQSASWAGQFSTSASAHATTGYQKSPYIQGRWWADWVVVVSRDEKACRVLEIVGVKQFARVESCVSLPGVYEVEYIVIIITPVAMTQFLPRQRSSTGHNKQSGIVLAQFPPTLCFLPSIYCLTRTASQSPSYRLIQLCELQFSVSALIHSR